MYKSAEGKKKLEDERKKTKRNRKRSKEDNSSAVERVTSTSSVAIPMRPGLPFFLPPALPELRIEAVEVRQVPSSVGISSTTTPSRELVRCPADDAKCEGCYLLGYRG